MMHVDDESVGVLTAGVPVRMAVRLPTFPTFVRMLVMLVVHVEMFVPHRFMFVAEYDRIRCWPQAPGEQRRQGGHESEHRECCQDPGGAAQPSRQWVGDQPAGVRQGELCGKQRRTVAVMAGAADEASRRRLHEGGPGAEEQPEE